MGAVHGLVLDTDANHLFVLQRTEKGDRELVIVHDLTAGTRKTLLSLPVSGRMETVALINDRFLLLQKGKKDYCLVRAV